jgi:membrane protease subunit (stomatin/prohibitin family)
MVIGDFLRQQFIDVIEWLEDQRSPLLWRFPMADHEIRNGASLTVPESQAANFVSEGRLADVCTPGRHQLRTRTLPRLTRLQHWDKGLESPFKSDVVLVSLRQQLDRNWGTPQPVTLRDKDFGAIRLRAFGNFASRALPIRRSSTARSPSRWNAWPSCMARACSPPTSSPPRRPNC